MSSRRGLTRLVDPWAALLLGVLVALGVVILLATPGPWHDVVGPAAVKLVEPPPSDIAVYVRASEAAQGCTTVAWLHVDYVKASATVVLVPPETEVPVTGGGFAPIGHLVADVGAPAATAGLAQVLETPLGGWVTIGREALGEVLGVSKSPGPDRLGMTGYREAVAALRAAPETLPALKAQQRTLARVLPAVPFDQLNQAAVVNYVLGSTEVDTDLDLRVASRLVRIVRSLKPGTVAVRTLPVIVERCGDATVWRMDRARAERIRLSLAYGLVPPSGQPIVTRRERTAEVVVLVPSRAPGARFATALRRALERGASGSVTVGLAPLPVTSAGGVVLRDLLARRRPLAVLVAPWLQEAGGPSPSPAASPSFEEVLADLLDGLAGASQAAVVLAPTVDAVPQATDSIAPAPAVLTSSDAGGAQGQLALSRQVRLAADAVRRACWPEYLAPRLHATRSGFSYAARSALTLAVVGEETPGGLAVTRRLAAAGYLVRPLPADAWTAPAEGPLVAYIPGGERAARALQDDLADLLSPLPPLPHGRRAVPLFAVDDAPESLTFVIGS